MTGVTTSQLGDYVRQRRQSLKLGVGDVTGPPEKLARQTWYDLEAGKHPPTEATQRKVAEVLGLPLDWADRAARGEAPPRGTVVGERPAPHVLDAIREHMGDQPERLAEAMVRGLRDDLEGQGTDYVVTWAVRDDGVPWMTVSPARSAELDEITKLRDRVAELGQMVGLLLDEARGRLGAESDFAARLSALEAARAQQPST